MPEKPNPIPTPFAPSIPGAPPAPPLEKPFGPPPARRPGAPTGGQAASAPPAQKPKVSEAKKMRNQFLSKEGIRHPSPKVKG